MNTRLRLVLAGALGALSLAAAACGTTGGTTTPPTPRFVAAVNPANADHVETRMSLDGLTWTHPVVVAGAGGAAVPADSAPGIAFDGTLYHLVWYDAAGALRYATSADGESWLASSTDLGVSGGGRPSIAVGGGTMLIANLSGGEVVVQQPDAPLRRTTIAGAAGEPALVYAGGRFVLAMPAGGPPSIRVLESTDGVGWSDLGSVPVAGGHPPIAASLAFAGGAFQLLAWIRTAGPDLVVFTSPDGRSWTAGRSIASWFGTNGIAIAGAGAGQLVLQSIPHVLARPDGAAADALVGWTAIGGPAATVGPGRPVASLRLDTVTILREEDGGGDEPYFLLFSFKSRVGRPDSTRVFWSGYLAEIASGLDEGRSAAIPPAMGATAWTVEEARNVGDPLTAQVDIMGAVVVAIDSDACPWSGVADVANRASDLLRGELDTLIARGTLAALTDTATRNAQLAAIRQRILDELGGSWIERFVGCTTDPDDQIGDQTVILVGTALFADDPAGNAFGLSLSRPVLPLTLLFRNDAAEWRAMQRVFGERAGAIPLTATKALLGHLLGSSGSIEAVATVLCLRHGELHPVPGCQAGAEADPDLPVSLVLDRPLPLPGVRAAVSTSLAFGGSNAALVFSRSD